MKSLDEGPSVSRIGGASNKETSTETRLRHQHLLPASLVLGVPVVPGVRLSQSCRVNDFSKRYPRSETGTASSLEFKVEDAWKDLILSRQTKIRHILSSAGYSD